MFGKISNAVLGGSVFVAVKTQQKFKELMANENGVTAIEYSMIAVAVSAMLYIVLGDGTSGDNFLGKIIEAFGKIKDSLDKSISAFPA
ncbi:Flp family type IVb pilin [Budvicia aquatica]|uniref:Flp family type IVb pilin n=2 Tax=Budvicia aquatica TaxID=82979 RepID=A0A2C6DLA1_9GAMM|nr:Flp family type IVb pilin [Budvicia aquatica]PHI29987.1 Flp family type IVb pilin [Budvicia aquatica]GKX51660.1 hypothetical protein SOASR029_19690 [Budvicia aquatica]